MNKLVFLTAALLMGIASSFAQVDIVQVTWDYDNCSGAATSDYVDVTVSIYDDANSQSAIKDVTVQVSIASFNVNVSVPEIDTYCNDSHDFTPSFTVYATVKVMDYSTNPPTENCTDSGNVGPKTCHEFYSGNVQVNGIQPN